MVKTVFENEETKEVAVAEYTPRVKQMTRKIGVTPDGVVSPIEEVDMELSAYINDGWKLSFVSRLATEPEGSYIIVCFDKRLNIEPYLFYIIAGKISLFVLQRFPLRKIRFLRKHLAEGKFLQELISCDLCLGVWIYTVLAYFFKINLYDAFYLPGLSELLTGATTSFIMHVFSAGWKSLYSMTVIGD